MRLPATGGSSASSIGLNRPCPARRFVRSYPPGPRWTPTRSSQFARLTLRQSGLVMTRSSKRMSMVWWEAQHAAVPPAVSGTPDCNLRRDGARRKLLVTERGRGDEPMHLDQPRRVVGFVERQQRLTQVLGKRCSGALL